MSSVQIVKSTVTFQLILFVITVSIAYFSFGKNMIPDIFILRKALRKSMILNVAGDLDLMMSIMQWVFVPILLLHVPVYLLATREIFFSFFDFKRSNFNVAGISVILTFVCFLFPVFYPDVISIIGITAGLFGFTVNIVIPFLIGFRMRSKSILC